MFARGLSAFFFFNDTATTEIYTLSLHDALPISSRFHEVCRGGLVAHDLNEDIPELSPHARSTGCYDIRHPDRKSTRLNSSHSQISYAVFCLKKKRQEFLCPTRVMEISAMPFVTP